VLLHGFTGSSGDFVHLFDLDALSRSYRLILPDLRGHGRSTNPQKTITHRQCALDMFALLDRLGIGRLKAVGVSFGGNILLHMATMEPDRIEAMVLTGAPSYFPKEARAFMAAFTVETRDQEEWRMMRERHKYGDEQIRALWEQGCAFKDSYEDMNFTPPLLGTIKARTLIVTGDRDPLYPVEIFVEQYRAIPRASLYVVPDGGHDAVFLGARGEFVRTALAFLRGAEGKEPGGSRLPFDVRALVADYAPGSAVAKQVVAWREEGHADWLDELTARLAPLLRGPEAGALVAEGRFSLAAFEALLDDLPGEQREKLQDALGGNAAATALVDIGAAELVENFAGSPAERKLKAWENDPIYHHRVALAITALRAYLSDPTRLAEIKRSDVARASLGHLLAQLHEKHAMPLADTLRRIGVTPARPGA
jgi:pimeloyl-ACP methyl ester carboxylesterase